MHMIPRSIPKYKYQITSTLFARFERLDGPATEDTRFSLHELEIFLQPSRSFCSNLMVHVTDFEQIGPSASPSHCNSEIFYSIMRKDPNNLNFRHVILPFIKTLKTVDTLKKRPNDIRTQPTNNLTTIPKHFLFKISATSPPFHRTIPPNLPLSPPHSPPFSSSPFPSSHAPPTPSYSPNPHTPQH